MGTLIHPNNLRRALRKALADAGITFEVRPHLLRSTVATAVARAEGAGLDAAVAVLGHSPVGGGKVALRHYVEHDKRTPDVTAIVQALVDRAMDEVEGVVPGGAAREERRRMRVV